MNRFFFAPKRMPAILAVFILLALPAICHAGCRLTSIKLIETEVGVIGADLIVEGSADIKRAPLGDRQIVYLGNCACKKGSHSIKADGRILEKIRWNFHEDENRVHVVFYFAQKTTPQISAYDGHIRVLFSGAENVSNAQPSPPPIKDALTPEQPKSKDGLPPFQGTAGPIPPNVEAMMKMYSWRDGCPVPISSLWLVQVTHFGYDGKAHKGRMIVNKSAAWEVVDIFRDMYNAKFPVERMELIDKYGDINRKLDLDAESMAHNNSSSFNCRMATAAKSTYSKHAGGLAIDINPLVNPYVKGDIVLPEQGRENADRSKKKKGMIFKGDAAHRAFTKRGWIWGGSWKSLKDYQHFEKKP